jgi:hypothetical protein
MLGPPKARRVDRAVLASLEALVPPDHFYRHLEAVLDLGFVRDLVRDRYAAGGRPSLDPVVFFRTASTECPPLGVTGGGQGAQPGQQRRVICDEVAPCGGVPLRRERAGGHPLTDPVGGEAQRAGEATDGPRAVDAVLPPEALRQGDEPAGAAQVLDQLGGHVGPPRRAEARGGEPAGDLDVGVVGGQNLARTQAAHS